MAVAFNLLWRYAARGGSSRDADGLSHINNSSGSAPDVLSASWLPPSMRSPGSRSSLLAVYWAFRSICGRGRWRYRTRHVHLVCGARVHPHQYGRAALSRAAARVWASSSASIWNDCYRARTGHSMRHTKRSAPKSQLARRTEAAPLRRRGVPPRQARTRPSARRLSRRSALSRPHPRGIGARRQGDAAPYPAPERLGQLSDPRRSAFPAQSTSSASPTSGQSTSSGSKDEKRRHCSRILALAPYSQGVLIGTTSGGGPGGIDAAAGGRQGARRALCVSAPLLAGCCWARSWR